MNFIKAFKDKNIRIPLLQRDYVQGCEESIISPFVDSLLDDSRKADLNYIYGYTEQGCFVPIDGQQRLTTLWLLYLYAAAKAGKIADFTVNLTFLSREFANDFCERLKGKIREVLSTMEKNMSLDKAIREQYWFINSWYNNATVRNMLLTLKYIHRKCEGRDFDKLWIQLLSDESITFAFLNMSEDNGLDDDIYVKMNGRGRPLSAFENLKSWMDEIIHKAILVNNEPWLHSWLNNIDNRWTHFFWNNRNKNQTHPEEIDDEQMFCFCNLLVLYWMKDINGLKSTIRSLKDDDLYLYEQLFLLFPQLNETDGVPELMNCLIDQIQSGNLLSLVWIERLNLIPLDFMKFAYDSLNKLSSIYSMINEMDLFFGGTTSNTKPIYDLALSKGSYGRTLPLLYAVLLIDEETKAKDWMRECRNLILNTDIDKEQLPDVLNSLDAFALRTLQSDVYEVLKIYDGTKDTFLNGFKWAQIVEERKKAKLPTVYYPQMLLMENDRFFSGRIYIMFRLLEHENGIKDYTVEDFVNCSNIMRTIFFAGEGRDGGVRTIYDNASERLLRRTLMSCPPYYYGYYKKANWCFCANMEEWRDWLNWHDSQIDALRYFIIDICLPAVKISQSNIEETIQNCMINTIDKFNHNYEEQLEQQNDEDKFSLHFVHHVGVWNYMETSRCDWKDYDDHGLHIFLKKTNSNNSNKMELRTYSLFLDYADTSIREDLKKDRNGWYVGIYPREETCMFFQLDDPESKREIAIDVFHNCGKENDYALNVFLRRTNDEENNPTLYMESNQNYFDTIFEKLSAPLHIDHQSCRFVTNDTYSRNGIILLLRKLLPAIKKHVELMNDNTK